MIRIFAYNRFSESARRLAEEMDVYLIKHENSRYRPRTGDTVINWGRGRVWTPARTLNHPACAEIAVNKRSFFQAISDPELFGEPPRIPEWTTDIRIAREWARDRKKVVVRKVLNGHEGQGIEIHDSPDEIPQAPLYVRYIPKAGEFRVHMVGGNIIDIQRKVLRRNVDRENANWNVRNTANGFVFQRNNIDVPEDIKTQALLALQASGLDFAAADVIWNEHRRQAFVLELNTAPGIEGTTIKRYAEELKRYIEGN